MALTWRTVSGNFSDVLYAFIKSLEAPKATNTKTAAQLLLEVVPVSGNPTIGVGFDLVKGGRPVQNEVMRALGFDSVESNSNRTTA